MSEPCPFVEQLSVLRRQSLQSVANVESFDDLKKYLHIARPIETELRVLLKSLNMSAGKRLILLCGSAGDGKSHMLSYFSQADPERLLDGYCVYNDATESSSPKLTSMETLAHALAPFNDEQYLLDDGYKMILAINLGTLNNLIESEQGRNFSALKKYVDENGLFSGYSKSSSNQNSNVFYHVNYADYQIFTLRKDGVGIEYLEEIFFKVFNNTDENPFFRAYTADSVCPICQRCPVRHNFELLSNPMYHKAIIGKIVATVIKDKVIVSTRDALNFIYDIIVHPEFSYEKLCSIEINQVESLTMYFLYTTPMLLYEFRGLSPLLNELRNHDILKVRNAEMDAEAMTFHALENIREAFQDGVSDTPYLAALDLTNLEALGSKKPELKKLLYRFIVRVKELKGQYADIAPQKIMSQYVTYLYAYNSGNAKGLNRLYSAVKKAVMTWNGQFPDDLVCIDDSIPTHWILEHLSISPYPYHVSPLDVEDIERFPTSIKLRFKKSADSDNPEMAELSLDYSLFEIILAMEEGYRPTAQDRSRHAEFAGFVQRILSFGNQSKQVTLIPKNPDSRYQRIVFEDTEMGYEFKVVQADV